MEDDEIWQASARLSWVSTGVYLQTATLVGDGLRLKEKRELYVT